MNIGPEWVFCIHCHKGLRSATYNNRFPHKLQLELVTVRLIHYLRVEIFYLWMNIERRILTWTMDKGFVDLYFEIYILKALPSPNGVADRCNMDHMGGFMLIPSYGNIISWYLWAQIINRRYWQRKKIQCIFIGYTKIIYRFSKLLIFLFPCVAVMPDWRASK